LARGFGAFLEKIRTTHCISDHPGNPFAFSVQPCRFKPKSHAMQSTKNPVLIGQGFRENAFAV
jgi:hypothetical protein